MAAETVVEETIEVGCRAFVNMSATRKFNYTFDSRNENAKRQKSRPRGNVKRLRNRPKRSGGQLRNRPRRRRRSILNIYKARLLIFGFRSLIYCK